MVEWFNLVMGRMHEILERVEKRVIDEERYRADQDGNHVRRRERHVSLVVDIGFDVIGDEDDDVASWGHRNKIQ
jgi:hypothetical protein